MAYREDLNKAVLAVDNWKKNEDLAVALRRVRAFTGSHDGWRFAIYSFPVGPDTFGTDGEAIKAGIRFRLEPALSNRALELAEASVAGRAS